MEQYNVNHPDCVPEYPRQPFKSIALTFSGGGFRAASFSLGALSYLYRCKYGNAGETLLHHVKFITSTSGGSLTNGKFSSSLYSDPGFSFGKFFSEMKAALDGQRVLQEVFAILKDDAQWAQTASYRENGRQIEVKKSRNLINAFAKAYDKLLFNGKTFDCIYSPVYKAPLEKVCFNTTEFNNGLHFYFQADGHAGKVDKYGNGYLAIVDAEVFRHLKIADMVAASSCFPSGFEPIIYPNDFIHGGLTDVGKMLKAIEYEHNDPTEIATVNNKAFALMDGGIVDNMGIRAVMAEDRRRLGAGSGSFDLILACDVTSYFVDPLSQPGPATSGWTTRLSLHHLLMPFKFAPLLLVLCVAAIVFNLGAIAGYLLLLPSLAASAAYWWLNGKLKRIRGRATGSIQKTVLDNSAYFSRLPLSSLIHMIKARLSSSILLVSDLFLKQIRRGQYDNLFTKPRMIHRAISCLIYEFSSAHRHRRLDILNSKDAAWWKPVADQLMPGDKMEKVANEARAMGTTLWFDESDVKGEKRDKIIATGQFTICYNLIKHILRLEVLDNKYKSDAALQKFKEQLMQDFEKFKSAPLFMIENLHADDSFG
jgi:hypothetical protein